MTPDEFKVMKVTEALLGNRFIVVDPEAGAPQTWRVYDLVRDEFRMQASTRAGAELHAHILATRTLPGSITRQMTSPPELHVTGKPKNR